MRRKNSGLPLGVLIALVAVAAVVCVIMIAVMYMDNHGMLGKSEEETSEENVQPDEGGEEDNGELEIVTAADNTDELVFPDFDNSLYLNDEAFASMKPDHEAVDIKKLQQEINPEIYAWLYIPETGIDYPVLQHEEQEDYTFYASHNEKGEPDPKGALNTEFLNKKEFKDYLTVIYGTHNADGSMFTNLDLFRDPAFFGNAPYIYVYTEDRMFIYKVFAAYEFDNVHLILNYITTMDFMYEKYVDQLEELAGLGANVDKTAWPTKDDRILTLMTHIDGKEDKRYLVQSTLIGVRDLKTEAE
jgi:sortase B